MSKGHKDQALAFAALTLAIGGGFACVAAFRSLKPQTTSTAPSALTVPIPSITAMQKKLNELEPENPLKCDGKLGRETQLKWDRVFIRESVRVAFERSKQKTHK